MAPRVLILGGAGMLGHKLWQAYRGRFDTWVSFRSRPPGPPGLFDPARSLCGVDVAAFDSVVQALARVRPDVVINCIGVIKQLESASDPILTLTVNSLFPHRLAGLCRAAGVRMIHVSTDCVFSGRKGRYTEDDVSDAEDLYGRTKFLGEVGGPGCLTVRTSIIGRELSTCSGMVEWFLSNRGKRVRGYSRAVYSGFTTLTLADVLGSVIEHHRDLAGVYQVSADPITKYDLLVLLRDAFGVPVEIEEYPAVAIDRSLDDSRFRAATRITPPTWPDMIRGLASDPTPYELWRSGHAA